LRPGARRPAGGLSQTSLEYMLLLGAVIFIIVIAVLVVRGQVMNPVANQVANNASTVKGVIRNMTG
jgi:uncharacterized protein (UPF0333 family)